MCISDLKHKCTCMLKGHLRWTSIGGGGGGGGEEEEEGRWCTPISFQVCMTKKFLNADAI